MSPAAIEIFRAELAAAVRRAEAAEARAARAERERDELRRLLIRLRTTLAEISDEPLPVQVAA